MTSRSILLMAGVLLAAAPALAQGQPDPRLAPELVQALQAQVALQQKALQVLQADAEAQKATLWEWLVQSRKDAETKVGEAK